MGGGKKSFFHLVEVGTPVAGRPPHRSRRAVFPHRALQFNTPFYGSQEGLPVVSGQSYRRWLPVQAALNCRPLHPSRSHLAGIALSYYEAIRLPVDLRSALLVVEQPYPLGPRN